LFTKTSVNYLEKYGSVHVFEPITCLKIKGKGKLIILHQTNFSLSSDWGEIFWRRKYKLDLIFSQSAEGNK